MNFASSENAHHEGYLAGINLCGVMTALILHLADARIKKALDGLDRQRPMLKADGALI